MYRSRIAATSIALASVLGLAACGDDSGTTKTPAAPTQSTAMEEKTTDGSMMEEKTTDGSMMEETTTTHAAMTETTTK
jgi:hypothetical protein